MRCVLPEGCREHRVACIRASLGRRVEVGRPTLRRYYGLWTLFFLVGFSWALLGILARILEIEWLLKWGFENIGALCAGLCSLLRGLDFIALCRKYPPFLRENAPAWDTQARKASLAKLLYIGIWFTLGGAMIVYAGGRNLVLAVLSTS
jgi:hypothetical protein